MTGRRGVRLSRGAAVTRGGEVKIRVTNFSGRSLLPSAPSFVMSWLLVSVVHAVRYTVVTDADQGYIL